MPKQFDGVTCALCADRPSSRNGEHVWPTWLLRSFPKTPRYTWFDGEKPIRKRDGTVRTQKSLQPVKLPVCSSCNGKLNSRFEKPAAKEVLRRILTTRGDVRLGSGEVLLVTNWILKTALLLAHPQAVYPESCMNALKWQRTGEELWRWTIADESPPRSLSLWVSRVRKARPEDPPPRTIFLPTVVAGDCETKFQDYRFEIASLDISVVHHPGWAIAHPLEQEGAAIRLWPRAEVRDVDLTALPRVSPRNTNWCDGPRVTLRDGEKPADLPPLAPGVDEWSLDHEAILAMEAPPLALRPGGDHQP